MNIFLVAFSKTLLIEDVTVGVEDLDPKMHLYPENAKLHIPFPFSAVKFSKCLWGVYICVCVCMCVFVSGRR